MNTNALATAAALSDHDLLARLAALAGRERHTLADLLAHLAALDARPSVYAAHGYGSLHAYCTQALRLSEDAASNRIKAARACRRFPVILVRPTAPERYRVQFTIGEATHEKLRRLQALLRREIPDGDPGAIFDRAVTLLLEHVENKKLGITARPRPRPRPLIRRETDNEDIRTPPPPSRDVPRAVKRAVWKRDGGRCAFVSADGHQCTERQFLDFHHVQAYAR